MYQNCIENFSVLSCFCCSDAIAKLNAYVEKQDEQVSKLEVGTKSHIIFFLKSANLLFNQSILNVRSDEVSLGFFYHYLSYFCLFSLAQKERRWPQVQ